MPVKHRKIPSRGVKELRKVLAHIDALYPKLEDNPSRQAGLISDRLKALSLLQNLETDEKETEKDRRIRELEQQLETRAKPASSRTNVLSDVEQALANHKKNGG